MFKLIKVIIPALSLASNAFVSSWQDNCVGLYHPKWQDCCKICHKKIIQEVFSLNELSWIFTRLAASSIEYGKVTSCYVDSTFPQPILLCIWSLLYSATTQRTNTQIFASLFRKDIISFQSKFSARIETVNLLSY